MTADGARPRFGTARIEPDRPVVVDTVGCWQVVYTVGEEPLLEGGRLLVACRWPSDWARLQVDEPAAPNYLAVECSGRARLRAGLGFERRHPWDYVASCAKLDRDGKAGVLKSETGCRFFKGYGRTPSSAGTPSLNLGALVELEAHVKQ